MSSVAGKHTIIVGHTGRGKKRAIAVVKHVNIPAFNEQNLRKIATIKISRQNVADKIIKNAQGQLREHGIAVPETTLRKMLSEIADKFPENFLKIVINMPPTVRGKLLAPAKSAAGEHEKESVDSFNYHRDLVRALTRIAIHNVNMAEDLRKLIEEERKNKAENGIKVESSLEQV